MANKTITNKTIIDTAPPVPNKRIIGGSNQRSNLRSVLETPTSWKYNHAPTSGLETENGAWWQNRAERYGVKLSGSGDMLYSRQAVQREALRNLDHRRNMNHSIEFGDSYHGGSNQMLNKNPRSRDFTFRNFEAEINITSSVYPDIKKRISFQATKGGENYSGELFTPFSVFKSTVVSGYRKFLDDRGLSNLDFTNFHGDSILNRGKVTPAQGPFTETHVGGIQARHNPPLMTSNRKEQFSMSINGGYAIATVTIGIGGGFNTANYNGKNLTLSLGGVDLETEFDNTADMEESTESVTGVADATNISEVATSLIQSLNASISEQGLRISVDDSSSGAVIIISSKIPGRSINGTAFGGTLIASVYGSSAAFAGGTEPIGTISTVQPGDTPRGHYLRGMGPKSPVNIANIKTLLTSNSVRIIGNYIKNYEVVQTSNRAATNMDFAFNSANYAYNAPTAFVNTIAMRALGRTGSADYPAPRQIATRRTNKTIFTGRFSAPGSKVDSNQLFRDVRSDQFSPNNALPFRNIPVRKPYLKELSTFTGQGGYLGTSTTVAAPIKTQRNSTQRVEIYETSPQLTHATGTLRDTYFFMRPIPAGNSTQWFFSLSGSDTRTYSDYVLSGSEYPSIMTVPSPFLPTPVAATHANYSLEFAASSPSDYDLETVILTDADARTLTFTYVSAKTRGDVVVDSPTAYKLGIGGGSPASASHQYAEGLRLGVIEAFTNGHLSIGVDSFFYLGPTNFTNLTQSVGGAAGNTVVTGSVIQLTLAAGATGTKFFAGGADAVGTYIDTAGYSGSGQNLRYIWSDMPYSAPWTQLRVSETRAGRAYRRSLPNFIELEPRIIDRNSRFSPSTFERTTTDQAGNSQTYFYSKGYHESFISSKYKPLKHKIRTSMRSGDSGKEIKLDLDVKYSYGTSLMGFANKELNEELDGNIKFAFGKVKRPYEILKEQASDDLSRDLNGIDTIKEFVYEETIYPKENYTYMSGTRGRLSFDNNYWRDNKSFINTFTFLNFTTFRLDLLSDNSETFKEYNSNWYRIRSALTNSQGYGYKASEQNPYSNFDPTYPIGVGPGRGSIWPLDPYIWADHIDTYVTALTGTFNTPVLLADQSTLPAGELMTPYFHAVADSNTNPLTGINKYNGLTSSYGVLGLARTETVSAQYVHTTAMVTGVIGSSPNQYQPEPRCPGNVYTLPTWSAGAERRYVDGPLKGQSRGASAPFYDSYEKYAEDIRLVGKEYTITPEFRVSEHVSEYANNSSFLSIVSSSLEITGASQNNFDSTNEDFYDRYTTTDSFEFLENFMSFDESNDNFIFNNYPRHLEISSEAIIKLLPYEGFYPVNRTLQIATQFSQSYSNSFIFTGTDSGNRRALRTVLRPFFSPGILYNSIKSGIAVDYPVRRSDRDDPNSWALIAPVIYNIALNKQDSKFGTPLYNGGLRALPYPALYTLDTSFGDGILPSNTRRLENMSFSTSSDAGVANRALFFGDRLPFDSILSPENYLSTGSNSEIISADSTDNFQYIVASASIEPSALTDTSLYKKSISNFLANVPAFFLKKKFNKYGHEGKLTKFVSQFGAPPRGTQESTSPKRKVTVEAKSAYMMEIGLMKTDQFNMYSNPHAFGPSTFTHGEINTWDTLKASGSFVPNNPAWPKHRGEFAPFTAPYYYGPSLVRITFLPIGDKKEYTLDEIINNDRGEVYVDFINESGSYYDVTSGSFVDANGISRASTTTPGYGWNRAWLNRMDIDASIFINNEFETGDGEKYKSSDPNKWTIMPKWECPILDFPNRASSAGIYNFSSSVEPGSYTQKTQGMWHQYGVEPSDNNGVYMYIKDIPTGKNEEYDRIAVSYVSTGTKPVPFTDFSGSYHHVRKLPKFVIDSGRKVESMADLCGFDPEEIIRQGFDPSKAKRLGELAEDDENSISEAILALPFYLDEKGSPNLVNLQAPANKLGPKIKEFRKNFTNYSLPPSLAYKLLGLVPKGYPQVPDVINPFGPDEYDEILNGSDILQCPVVYLMEHKVSLSKQDLSDIWQNIMPDISNRFSKSFSAIDHYMPGDNVETSITKFPEVLKEQISLGVTQDGHPRYDLLDIAKNCSDGFVPEIRWLVFKVKQRGVASYAQLIAEEVDGPDALGYDNNKELMLLQGLPSDEVEKILTDRDEFSKNVYIKKHALDSPTFNWPYDYCSLIELSKINGKVGFRPDLQKEFKESQESDSSDEQKIKASIENIAKSVMKLDKE
jgi:hypothetical protein